MTLKIEIDRPTIACLLVGVLEISKENSTYFGLQSDDFDYESHCLEDVLVELFNKAAESLKPKDLSVKVKIQYSDAWALRRLLKVAQPNDAWTLASMVSLSDKIDQFIGAYLVARRTHAHAIQPTALLLIDQQA